MHPSMFEILRESFELFIGCCKKVTLCQTRISLNCSDSIRYLSSILVGNKVCKYRRVRTRISHVMEWSEWRLNCFKTRTASQTGLAEQTQPEWSEWRLNCFETRTASQTGLAEQAQPVCLMEWNEWRLNCSETKTASQTGLAEQAQPEWSEWRLNCFETRTGLAEQAQPVYHMEWSEWRLNCAKTRKASQTGV